MSEPYLLLWLEAPLQAWGYDSKFGRRDSLDFPTKSGVLGLLCCALGAAGEQAEWLQRWAERDLQVTAFVPADRQGQPVPRLPLLRDFHMVGSSFDQTDPWQDLLVPKKSDGGKPNGSGAKMTYRYYLQDMAYAVALQGPEAELQALADALQNPVWDLYLGRKACVPTEFVYQGVYDSLAQAMQRASELAEEKSRHAVFRVLQGEHEGEVLTLNDVPLQFGEHKQYRDRRVTVQKME